MTFTKKILLLGSGELGREFTISAKRLGAYVIACDSYDHAPAMQVADSSETLSMLDAEKLRAVIQKHQPDLIVPEVEAIRTEILADMEAEGFHVVPSARASSQMFPRCPRVSPRDRIPWTWQRIASSIRRTSACSMIGTRWASASFMSSSFVPWIRSLA